jgi:hypothetical protein
MFLENNIGQKGGEYVANFINVSIFSINFDSYSSSSKPNDFPS